MTRNFSTWLASFKSSIATYSYYVDFPKIYQNIDAIKVELNILNSLIGSDNIESDFVQIVTKYPETLKCIPLLLAIRGREIEITDEKGSFVYKFDGSEHFVTVAQRNIPHLLYTEHIYDAIKKS